jgi:glutathione S-transferase
LVKTGENDEPIFCSNVISIMMELSRVAYLEEILFGKKDSKERLEIVSFIELAQRTEVEQLIAHVNKHLAMRMFLVGQSITAADIIVQLYIAEHFKELMDFQKMELAHTFRWLDHIQHLPGMDE